MVQTKPKDKIKLLNYSHLKRITHDNTSLSNVCRSNNFKDFINHTNTLIKNFVSVNYKTCLLYTSPSPRDGLLSRMPSSA